MLSHQISVASWLYEVLFILSCMYLHLLFVMNQQIVEDHDP